MRSRLFQTLALAAALCRRACGYHIDESCDEKAVGNIKIAMAQNHYVAAQAMHSLNKMRNRAQANYHGGLPEKDRLEEETLLRFLGTLTKDGRPDPESDNFKFITMVMAWIGKQTKAPDGAAPGEPQPLPAEHKDNSQRYGHLDGLSVIIFCDVSRYSDVQEPLTEEDSESNSRRVLDTAIGMYVRADELADVLRQDSQMSAWAYPFEPRAEVPGDASLTQTSPGVIQLSPRILDIFKKTEEQWAWTVHRVASELPNQGTEAPGMVRGNFDFTLFHELTHTIQMIGRYHIGDGGGYGWSTCVSHSNKGGHLNADNVAFFAFTTYLIRMDNGIKFTDDGKAEPIQKAMVPRWAVGSRVRNDDETAKTTLQTVRKRQDATLNAEMTLSVDLPGGKTMNLPIPQPPEQQTKVNEAENDSQDSQEEIALKGGPTLLEASTTEGSGTTAVSLPTGEAKSETIIPVIISGTTTKVKYVATETSSGNVGPTKAWMCTGELCDEDSECIVPDFCADRRFKSEDDENNNSTNNDDNKDNNGDDDNNNDDELFFFGYLFGLRAPAKAQPPSAGILPPSGIPPPAGVPPLGVMLPTTEGGGGGGGGGGRNSNTPDQEKQPQGKPDNPEKSPEVEPEDKPENKPEDKPEDKPKNKPEDNKEEDQSSSCSMTTTTACDVSFTLDYPEGTQLPSLSEVTKQCTTVSGCEITASDVSATETGEVYMVTPIVEPPYTTHDKNWLDKDGKPLLDLPKPTASFQTKLDDGVEHGGFITDGPSDGESKSTASTGKAPLCTPFQKPRETDSGGCRCSSASTTTELPFQSGQNPCGYTELPDAPGTANAANEQATKQQPWSHTVTPSQGGSAYVEVCDEWHEERIAGSASRTKCDVSASTVSTIGAQETGEPTDDARKCRFTGMHMPGNDCSGGGAALFGLTCAYRDPISLSSLAFLDNDRQVVEPVLWKDDSRLPFTKDESRVLEANQNGIQESVEYKWLLEEKVCECIVDEAKVPGTSTEDTGNGLGCHCDFACHAG